AGSSLNSTSKYTALHPFPTRRSSDLDAGCRAEAHRLVEPVAECNQTVGKGCGPGRIGHIAGPVGATVAQQADVAALIGIESGVDGYLSGKTVHQRRGHVGRARPCEQSSRIGQRWRGLGKSAYKPA